MTAGSIQRGHQPPRAVQSAVLRPRAELFRTNKSYQGTSGSTPRLRLGPSRPDQAERLPEMRSIGVVLVVAFATVLHAAGWYVLHERVSPPAVVGQLASVSFSPIAAGHDGEKDVTTEEQIRSDLA